MTLATISASNLQDSVNESKYLLLARQDRFECLSPFDIVIASVLLSQGNGSIRRWHKVLKAPLRRLGLESRVTGSYFAAAAIAAEEVATATLPATFEKSGS